GVVLVMTLLIIVGLAQVLKRPRVSGPLPAPRRGNPRALPVRVAAGLLAWVVVAEGLTQLWYRLHESNAVPNAHWSAFWPEGPDKAQTVPIDSTVLAILRCSDSKAGVWQDSIGNRWQAFFLRWAPGRNSAQLASAHTPEICLRGA